jgi:hypothetical protein
MVEPSRACGRSPNGCSANRIVSSSSSGTSYRVLASAHGVSAGVTGADAGLLPFLTTDNAPLLAAAREVILARLTRLPDLGMSPAEPAASVDAIVRLVLSHVMASGTPTRTADDLAWIVARLLGPPSDPAADLSGGDVA